MDFWSTVKGYETADAILRIARQLEKKQYTLRVSANDVYRVQNVVEQEIKNGSIYVDQIKSETEVLLIFEKA